MIWHVYTAVVVFLVLTQLLFLWQSRRNYTYALKKSARRHLGLRHFTLLTVPCKGIDNAFERNISSIINQDYGNFVLHFVVEDESDPAYQPLCELRDRLGPSSRAKEIRVLVSGKTSGCSQKIHNLLHSCRNAPDRVQILAFADSDACLKPTWLEHLVYPLRKGRYGASTGYRWFVPAENNLASLAMSAINGKIAQLLGNTNFNQLWGGSMAIRAETVDKIDLEAVWGKAIGDDLSLAYAIKKAGMKIIFAPGCMVASYERTTWANLFEFARRQFVITRVTIPRTWWFGLFCIVYALFGVWGAGALAIYAFTLGMKMAWVYLIVPVLFISGQIYRTIFRQKMIAQLLPEDAERMRPAAIADIIGTFFWSWMLFVFIAASAVGRTITWRGIRYKLIGPTETIVLGRVK